MAHPAPGRYFRLPMRSSLLFFCGALLLAAPAPAVPTGTEQQLLGLVSAGRHPNLRWPDFTDVQADLDKIYAAREWRPIWIADDTLTSPARALLKVLEEAGNRGLDP